MGKMAGGHAGPLARGLAPYLLAGALGAGLLLLVLLLQHQVRSVCAAAIA